MKWACLVRQSDTKAGAGTNSGMDYWNGALDCTTELGRFPFLDKFLFIFRSLNIDK